jgi:hypothetical protein
MKILIQHKNKFIVMAKFLESQLSFNYLTLQENVTGSTDLRVTRRLSIKLFENYVFKSFSN